MKNGRFVNDSVPQSAVRRHQRFAFRGLLVLVAGHTCHICLTSQSICSHLNVLFAPVQEAGSSSAAADAETPRRRSLFASIPILPGPCLICSMDGIAHFAVLLFFAHTSELCREHTLQALITHPASACSRRVIDDVKSASRGGGCAGDGGQEC